MILHVLDDRDPQACGTTLALIAQTIRTTPGPHRVLLLGGSDLERAARGAGIAPTERIGVPLGHPLLAPTTVHRAMHPQTDPEEIHAWSVTALSTAAVFRPNTPRVYHVTQQPDAATLRRLNRLMLHAGYDAYVLTPRHRAALLSGGLPPGRVFIDDVRLDVEHLTAPQSGETHADADDDDGVFTIALLAEPAWTAHSYTMGVAASILQEVTGLETRLLVHPAISGRPEMQAMLDAIGRTRLLVQDSRLDRPWEILATAEVVLLDADAGPLSVCVARACGRPLIAPDTHTMRELLDGAPDVVWAAGGRARNFAHALTVGARRHGASAPAAVA